MTEMRDKYLAGYLSDVLDDTPGPFLTLVWCSLYSANQRLLCVNAEARHQPLMGQSPGGKERTTIKSSIVRVQALYSQSLTVIH